MTTPNTPPTTPAGGGSTPATSPETASPRTTGPGGRGRTKTPYDKNKERLKDDQRYKDVYGDDARHKHVLDFHDQCFLVDFMSKFVELKGNGHSSLLWAPRHVAEVKNADNAKSKTFLSKISYDSGQAFFNRGAPVSDMWNIRPNIRIYKIIYDKNGKEIKLKFPSKAEIDKQIGVGVHTSGKLFSNIEEFSFNYEGVNPAEVDYSITAELRMYFNHADALFQNFETTGSDGNLYTLQFSDLIKRPTWNKEAVRSAADSNDGYRDWDERFFRIWVEIDYDIDALSYQEKIAHEDFYESLKNQKASFFLNILKHELEIENHPGMPFYLNVQYIAAAEGAMNNRENADILGSKLLPGAAAAAASPTAVRFQALERAMTESDIGLPGAIEKTEEEQDKFFKELFVGDTVRLRNEMHKELSFNPDLVIGDLELGQLSIYRTPARAAVPAAGAMENFRYVVTNSDITMVLASDATNDKYGSSNIYSVAQIQRGLYNKVATKLNSARATAGLPPLTAAKLMQAVLLAHEYNELRQRYHELMKENTMPLQERYVLLIDELFGNLTTGWEDEDTREQIMVDRASGTTLNPSSHGSRARTRTRDPRANVARRVYEVELHGDDMHAYITKKTELKKASEERLQSLKNRADLGDKQAQRELQNTRLNAAAKSKRNLANFWRTKFKEKFAAASTGTVAFAPLILTANQNNLQSGTGQEATNYRFELLEKVAEDRRNATGDSKQDSTSAPLGRYHRPIKGEKYHLQWMYLGDLIDAALTIVGFRQDALAIRLPRFLLWGASGLTRSGHPLKAPRFEKDPSYKVVFGNFSYDDSLTGREETISMAKIPVSLKLFNEFWTEFVVDPQIEHYPFQQFIKDICTYIINSCFTSRCAAPGDIKNNIVATYSILSQNKSSKDKIILEPGVGAPQSDYCPKASVTQRSVPAKGIGPRKTAESIVYIYCTTNNLHHIEVGSNILKTHEKNNIMHIELGKLSGDSAPGVKASPIQSISFSKTDIPGYLEAKGEQAGLADNPLELSEPYNVNLSLIGNMAFKPGVHFYLMLPYLGPDPLYEKIAKTNALRPSGTGNKAAILGLGGYYMVTKCKNTISAADQKYDWTTDVTALWVGYPVRKKAGKPTFKTAPPAAGTSITVLATKKWASENAVTLGKTFISSGTSTIPDAPPRPLPSATCFVAGTMVDVVDKAGNNYKKDIKDIQKGDAVLALNENTLIVRPRLVTKKIIDPDGQPLLRLHINGIQETIDVTHAHPFYVKEKQDKWVPAADLQPGDTLTRYIPELNELVEVTVGSIEELRHLEPTYNIEVEIDHTYIVNGIVVHNKGP